MLLKQFLFFSSWKLQGENINLIYMLLRLQQKNQQIKKQLFELGERKPNDIKGRSSSTGENTSSCWPQKQRKQSYYNSSSTWRSSNAFFQGADGTKLTPLKEDCIVKVSACLYLHLHHRPSWPLCPLQLQNLVTNKGIRRRPSHSPDLTKKIKFHLYWWFTHS